METNKRRVISLLVDNQSGVLARVSSLFCRRGFNIDSLTVSATNDPAVSRITVTITSDEKALSQLILQTERLEVTRQVFVLDGEKSLERELLLLKVASYITDPVTTTDELIPSGETSSYRSNPLGLAEFTLSRKDPEYVGRAKAVQAEENARRAGAGDAALLAKVNAVPGCEQLNWNDIQIASTIFAVKPGDGSAREQAASCQRVLGAGANIVTEYATKRYRSNLINWGMLPLQLAGATPFGLGDYVLIPNVREALKGDLQSIKAYVLGDTVKEFELYMAPLTTDERQILADGCLINFYKH